MKKPKISLESLEPMFEKIGSLSKIQRILICVGTFLLLIGGFFYLSYMPKFKEIDKLNVQQRKLDTELKTAKMNARQLKRYKQEMKEAEGDFAEAMAALPEKKEIPSLLENVSLSGQDSGLEFLNWRPNADKVIDFYAEIPVSIEVVGGYHNLALFFDKVSRMSRIVNIRDIDISSGKSPGELDARCTAVTYRFLESQAKEDDKNRRKTVRK